MLACRTLEADCVRRYFIKTAENVKAAPRNASLGTLGASARAPTGSALPCSVAYA